GVHQQQHDQRDRYHEPDDSVSWPSSGERVRIIPSPTTTRPLQPARITRMKVGRRNSTRKLVPRFPSTGRTNMRGPRTLTIGTLSTSLTVQSTPTSCLIQPPTVRLSTLVPVVCLASLMTRNSRQK